MNRLHPRRPIPRLVSLGAVAILTLPLMGQPPARDRSKADVIEPPVIKVVKNSASPAPRPDAAKAPDLDRRKGKIEFPTKGVVTRSAPSDRPSAAARTGDDPANPTVKAGEVKWHPSFAAACEAAKKSGKPVLLFHMMGHLDKQFC